MTDPIGRSANSPWSHDERLAALELDRDALQRRVNKLEESTLALIDSLTSVFEKVGNFSDATATALQAMQARIDLIQMQGAANERRLSDHERYLDAMADIVWPATGGKDKPTYPALRVVHDYPHSEAHAIVDSIFGADEHLEASFEDDVNGGGDVD